MATTTSKETAKQAAKRRQQEIKEFEAWYRRRYQERTRPAMRRRSDRWRPHGFRLHVNYCEEPRGLVWTVHTRGRNHWLTQVEIKVPVETFFRGKDAEQPRAFLTGIGVLRITKPWIGSTMRIGTITER